MQVYSSMYEKMSSSYQTVTQTSSQTRNMYGHDDNCEINETPNLHH